MNELPFSLLTILSDGYFHSGTELGLKTGRTRTAVWKAIQHLQLGKIDIYSVRGKGYRLASPVQLLNKDSILEYLAHTAISDLQQVDVCYELESTNAYLLELSKNNELTGYACLAERQTMGRGRRGRKWISPFGGNIYLSLLWRFSIGAGQLGGLSLAMAVAVTRALDEIGFHGAGVKWPNDIVIRGQKLAGILLEITGETAGPCTVVVGVGLNVRKGSDEMKLIDQPWTDLYSQMKSTVDRNELAAALLGQLMSAAKLYELDGLTPFLGEWQKKDVYAGKEVVVSQPHGETSGIVEGVDENGALLLSTGGEVRCFYSGEVSMRLLD